MNKKTFSIGLDIEAINELYTYGGEQGKKKESLEDEMMDFENGIIELANQCIAAMNREKPSDPIVYQPTQSNSDKRSFEQKFQINAQGEEPEGGAADKEEEKPNYFRPNFNVPQTMRGIKNLALSIGGVKQGLKRGLEREADLTNAGNQLEIAENDEEDLEDYQEFDKEMNVKKKGKLQIIDYDIIQDQEEFGLPNVTQEPSQENLKTDLSQKSDDFLQNNSKGKIESFEEASEDQ